MEIHGGEQGGYLLPYLPNLSVYLRVFSVQLRVTSLMV
jgi:hypothetical protein